MPTAEQIQNGILDFSQDAGGAVNRSAAFVGRATDPVLPGVSTPGDFAAQYPTPLDPTEILAMCDEIRTWQYLPELPTGLKEETWREMTSLEFVSGSHYVAFADGECPEETQHDGSNRTVTLKNLGAKKSLTESDIMHSMAVASLPMGGINALLGGFPSTDGMPGGVDIGSFFLERIISVKEKEIELNAALVLNGWDRVLVAGDATTYPYEFDGIETLVTSGNGAHTNDNTASGTFSASSFDRFIGEACAKPQTVFGHPQAIQEMMGAYFQLGWQGSQVINLNDQAGRIIPGFNFASFVNTAVGTLEAVADTNFTVADMGNGAFQATLYALRMRHNGEPFVYKRTQIPLAYKDLAPGCTAISFQIWVKTALIIKAYCAQNAYTSQFAGRIQTTCPAIG